MDVSLDGRTEGWTDGRGSIIDGVFLSESEKKGVSPTSRIYWLVHYTTATTNKSFLASACLMAVVVVELLGWVGGLV